MKRNFLTGIAMMVAAFFFGAEIAQAADISFSGSIRTRLENENRTDFTEKGSSDHGWIAQQTRLNATAKINADTSAFVQLQSAHTWGNNSSYTASDGDASIGLHEAYFTIKNFAGQPLTAKVGRQQVVLDGHRLFGHTGWTTGAQTHDAVKLSHSHGNQTTSYFYLSSVEIGNAGGNQDVDKETHLIHSNFQGVMGGALSTYLVFTDDDCGINNNTCTVRQSNRWITLGARQTGKAFGLDYRAEYYHQVGGAGGADTQISSANVLSSHATAHGLAGFTSEATRDAFMFGVRVGKAFKNVTWKPKITLWYDYLSGVDDEDMDEGTWSAFDTHFDTGHKFYGFMDMFLNNTGANTNFMGLQDIAVKLVMKPAPKWTLKADWHNFHTAETVGGNPDVATRTGLIAAPTSTTNQVRTQLGDRGHGSEIGHEVDVTLVHAYNPNVKLSFGYSQFMAESLYHLLDGNTMAEGWNNTGHWAYVQAAVKF